MVFGAASKITAELYENTQKAVKQMGLEEIVALSYDRKEMSSYGVLKSPAIVVDGKVMAEGKLFGVDEIVRILEKA